MLNGYVHPDFASAVAALSSQLPRVGRGGGALCVYHRGVKVVDVWGGTCDDAGSPWREDTLAPSFSTSKGVLSTLVHLLAERGALSYGDAVADHWPAFGCRGKEQITIHHALCHEAGLYRIGDMISAPAEMLDWQHMLGVIADAEPAHQPGEWHGYHALTYGWLIGGLIEAVTGQRLSQVLRELLVTPLALDGAYIGLPDEAMSRRALLTNGYMKPSQPRSGWQGNLRDWVKEGLFRLGMDVGEFRAALFPFQAPFDWNAPETVQAVIPAANGQFTARSLARMYALIAQGGALEGTRLLSAERVAAMRVVHNRSRDRVLFLPMHWRLGYHRAFTVGVRAPEAFGHYGYGGSGGFCDPSRQLALAFTTNYGAGTPTGDTRMPRLARAAIQVADRLG
jgi:CubicO group peptidase (beta-lactamase class C family)